VRLLGAALVVNSLTQAFRWNWPVGFLAAALQRLPPFIHRVLVSRRWAALLHLIFKDHKSRTKLTRSLPRPGKDGCVIFSNAISLPHSHSNCSKGLGAAWGAEKALELLSEARFGNVDVRQLQHDIINNYYIAAKS
jgi:hypothetical protein